MAPLDALVLERLRARVFRTLPGEPGLVLGWPGFEEVLPDGGLPRGVVQLAAPAVLAGATSVALAAVRAAQVRDARAWCAWIDPEATLFGPGVATAGVDLSRLLVVHAPRTAFMRAAVKIVASQTCEVVVVDMAPIRGASPTPMRLEAVDRFVRKLALASENAGGTVLLLTDGRTGSLPVALRLELSRLDEHLVRVYVGKDRHGRVGLERSIPWRLRAGETDDQENL